MLTFLLIAYLTGVSAFGSGAGVCVVNANYQGVDTGSMPQNQNPNYGTFVATAADGNGAASTTYDSTSRTITVTSTASDLICGILGYFADNANTQNKVGNWEPNSLIQVEWSACPVNSTQAFTHRTWSTSQASVSVDWSFPAPMAHQTGVSAGTIPIAVTYPYPGKFYWIMENEIIIGGEIPTPAQIKAGHNSTDQPAFKSGNSDIQGSNVVNNIRIGSGLPHTVVTAYYFVEIASPPTLSFQSYIVEGNRGDVPNEQFYRSVAADTGNLKLAPAATPFDGPVDYATFLSGSSHVGPVMMLVAFCVWMSSRLM